MNVQQQDDIIEIIEQPTNVDITVAAGVDGRRGSYFFVGTLANPNSAIDYTEITQDPDVHVYLYDVYFSSSSQQQWQYRNGPSGTKWYSFQSAREYAASTVGYFKATIDGSISSTHHIAHNFNTYDVMVQTYSLDAPNISVGAYVERTSANQVRIKLNDLGRYVVLIIALPVV